MTLPRTVAVRVPIRLAILMGILLISNSAWAAPRTGAPLADDLQPFWRLVSGEPCRVEGTIDVTRSGQKQSIALSLVRRGEDAFDLTVTHAEYAVSLRRRGGATALALPKHGVVFWGTGDVHPQDHLAPQSITTRLVTPRTSLAMYVPLVLQANPESVALVLSGLWGMRQDEQTGEWKAGDKLVVKFPERGAVLLQADGLAVRLRVTEATSAAPDVDAWPGMSLIPLSRRDLERQLARGARRLLEILAPSAALTRPEQTPRRTSHGELRWIEGQRVVLLHGTAEEVGRAHGELLREEAKLGIDSVLHAFGTIQTIRTGRWFRTELDQAHARLAPHIPQRHVQETRALALALGEDQATVEAVNVFPEMFHCSGFALFGKATRDGKLYHGRVLDYMTEIGLQDAATTFIVKPRGQIPFANVGYAGFVGSVSGMNARGVSLGEMGGRGEGAWDGVPMATLMRRALEECQTLDDVMLLWKNSPRTCEYYYVFADGKTNRAVGVAAVPESIEFIFPGESHPLLGEGIEDTVLLSAGERLQTLRQRVESRHGQLDASAAMWLMSRPVAMQSNLHNVLFVPGDGALYVAQADHRRPAAECPYVRLELGPLLAQMPDDGAAAAEATSE